MNPYLMRNRTSSTSSQKAQSKEEASSEAISKTKNTTNKTLKMKDPTKVISARSIIQAKKTRNTKNTKNNTPISQAKSITHKEKYRSTRKKKLSTEEIDNIVKLEKVMTRNSSNMNKQGSKDKKRKIITRTKNISNLKQVSLKESFLNQSKMKFLRSHQNSKNSKNMLAKKSNVNKKKLPVYECVSPENSSENISEIYEFKFDVNDSTERIPKKRKKKAIVKKTLANRKKNNIPIKQVSKKKPTINESKEIKKADSVESENKNSVKPSSESRNSMLKEDLMENSKTNLKLNKESKESENIIKEQTVDKTITKPTIISVEDLSDKRISVMDTSETLHSDDFKPFRPTNIFNNKLMTQQKNALNYSLFEKSLSPITKSLDNSQINSPWRASPLLTFSQVKNVFQSTPQNNKYDVINKRFLRTSNNESKQLGNITKIKNNVQKNNENIITEGHISTNIPKKKNSLTLRKFGTEITNIDHSLQFKSPVEQRNERILTETENNQPNVQLTNAVTSNVINAFKFDNNENKKNNVLTPKKNLIRNVIEVKAQIHQEDVSNVQVDEQKENLDPQPGPSGLQSRSLANDQKILRQSNLHNFLNIMEMPQSTTIKTAHGVFDDIQSTPISRAVKKPNVSNLEINSAFGFSDDDSDKEISSIGHNIKSDRKEKAVETNLRLYDIKPPTRLSIGEIKNKLLVKKLKEDIHNKENIITEKKEIKKSPIKKKNKQPFDVANFSDTFDILSETGEIVADSLSNVSLFTDFEPSHFTQPPRHSYKRKRAVKFSFSEEESADEEERMLERERKRKKPDKLKKEQEERLMEWVQNINETFNEVDQHELVIE